MKQLLILILGIFTFAFAGATPPVNENPTNINYTIVDIPNFEQINVIDIDSFAEVQLKTFLSYNAEEINHLTISNVIGIIVTDFTFNKNVIDISSLPNGLYFIKIDYKDKRIIHTKFIKNSTQLNNQDTIFLNPPTLFLFKEVATKKIEQDKNEYKNSISKTAFVSNVGYIDHLIFIKPFEKGWSNTFIKRT